MVNLTTKEIFLLEGEKYQQQLAIDKYNDYALQADDNNLKRLFTNLSNIEQKHLNMIDKILQGNIPSINNQEFHPYYENNSNNSIYHLNIGNITLTPINNDPYHDGDKIICFNALATQELLHSTYSTSNLEFENQDLKKVLDFIINEKSQSINYINEYMSNKGMNDNIIFF